MGANKSDLGRLCLPYTENYLRFSLPACTTVCAWEVEKSWVTKDLSDLTSKCAKVFRKACVGLEFICMPVRIQTDYARKTFNYLS